MLKLATIFLLSSFCLFSNIKISEFQYAPSSGEPEWVELYNYSNNSYEISNWQIGDSKTSAIIPDIDIPPFSYLVITKEPELLLNKYSLPKNALVLDVNLPALNNTGDQIKVFNQDSILIDSLFYGASWGDEGKSLERVDFDMFASQANLLPSKSPLGGTPTLINTNKIVAIDIELEYAIRIDTTLSFKVINLGENDITDFDLDFRVDINRDGFYSEIESVVSEYQGAIPSKEIEVFNYSINDLFRDIDIFGSFNTLAWITLTGDENNSNDTIHYELILPAEKNSLLVNEIMFDVDDNSGEFIELYNNSNFVLNLKSWEIFDKTMWDNKDGVTIQNDIIMMPRDIILLAWDENLYKQFQGLEFDESVYMLDQNITLNNTGDLIVIADPDRIVIDSLTYQNDWHSPFVLETKNRSIEKIKNNLPSSEKANWTSCSDVSGATPLQENSFNNKLSDEFGLDAKPNPFFITSRNFDGNNCSISYTLPYSSSSVNIFIYDQNGNLISTIYEGQFSSSSGAFVWNGTDKDGKFLQTGPYVVYLEAIDQGNGDTFSDKILVVIGNN